MCGAEGPVEAALPPHALQASEEGLDWSRRRAHNDSSRLLRASKVGDGGIFWLALCAILAEIILLSLRHFTATGCAPGIGLLPLVALEDIDPRAGSGFAGARFGGCVRWAPEDALPTIELCALRSQGAR